MVVVAGVKVAVALGLLELVALVVVELVLAIAVQLEQMEAQTPVSYTHLTLPTTD